MALNREEIKEVLRTNGSVSMNGRLITTEEQIPSEADLAKTQEEKDAVVAKLRQQVSDQQAQIKDLTAKPVNAQESSDKK